MGAPFGRSFFGFWSRWDAGGLVLAVLLCVATVALPAPRGADPLASPVWDAMATRYLDAGPFVFDERVAVRIPPAAEDALAVPVEVDATALDHVEELRVIADLNPIPLVLAFRPTRAEPRIGFRFKVEQSTPVRAAARTADGVWHVGGAWLRASGGGCTAPSMGTGSGLWRERLNEVSATQWPRAGGISRLKLRIIHPMDTGLAGGIPAFYLESLSLLDAQGAELAWLHPFEPVSENPVLSFDLRSQGPVHVVGRDLQGNRVDARIVP